MLTHVWYAAYGSNLNRDRFAKYLGIEPAEPTYPQDEWMESLGSVRMAGHSERWGGGVAFFDVSSDTAILRRYLLAMPQFLSLWSGENRGEELPNPDRIVDRLGMATLAEPEVRIDVAGSYNLAWMLDTIEGVPAFTITTSKAIPAAPASESYLAVIRDGLAESPATAAFQMTYLSSVQTRP